MRRGVTGRLIHQHCKLFMLRMLASLAHTNLQKLLAIWGLHHLVFIIHVDKFCLIDE
jgi:hypothetical protein